MPPEKICIIGAGSSGLAAAKAFKEAGLPFDCFEKGSALGGTWRYVMTANGGFEVAFHGEFREIVANERIVSTEVYEAMPDGEALNTITFSEQDGRTTLTLLVEHTSQQDRDMHIGSGMEVGLQEAMDHLEQVAIALA